MQQLMQDEAGNVFEVDAAGNPIRMVTPAAPSKGRVFSLPQNPKEIRQEARQDAADHRADEAAQRAERASERADKTAQRQAAAAELSAKGAVKPSEFQSKSAGFLGRMIQAEKDFGAVPEDERGGRGLARQAFHNALPGVENTFVNSADRQKADQAVENFIAASLRQESGASIGPSEFERQYRIFFPAAGDSPEVLTQKANARRQAIEGFRIAAGPLADAAAGIATQKADNEVPDHTTGAALKPGTTPTDPGAMPPANSGAAGDPTPPPNDPRYTVASGSTRTLHSDRMSAQVDALLNSGASKAMIDAVLKRQNLAPLDPASFSAAKGWMQKNPGKRYYGADINSTEDMSLLQRAAGSAPGAFIAQGADALTAGAVGAMAGDKGRGALDAMGDAHPTASFLGSVAGGVGSMGLLEGAVAARAPAALAQYAPRIADALYGGVTGFNKAKDGEGIPDALIGAGAGVVGGIVGDRAMRGVASAVRGVRDPAVQALRGLNIPLTVGQAVGSSSAIGRGVKKIEDAATSLPFVGNMVDARRREGFEGLNRAAFDIGAETTAGQVQDYGTAGVQQLAGLRTQAYRNALDPVTLDVTGDPHLPVDLMNTQVAARSIPQIGDDAANALEYRVDGGMNNAGEMSGRDFQEAYRGLARDGRAAANGPYAHEYAGVMRDGQDALIGALERQNPGAHQGFMDANTANRRLMVLADAVDAAKNTEGQLFSAAQLNAADARSANRLTGKLSSASGDRPFHDLATNAQQVLPSKLPDSGTSTRMLTGLALGGGAGAGAGYTMGDTGAGTATGLGATLALALGGSRPAQAAATRALLDRPDIAIRLGDILRQQTQIGGRVGAATGTALVSGY